MSGEELLRTHIEKLSQGDLDGAVADYEDDAVLHYPGQGPLAGDYRGRDEIKRFYSQVGERTGGTFSVTYEALFSDQNHAAALAWQRAVVSAVTVSGDHVHADTILQSVEREAANILGGMLVSTAVEWIE